MQQTITEVSYKDALTGLRNGATCDMMLEDMTKEMASGMREFAIAVMDVDKTHIINDKYGREKGDEYLKNCSALICYTFKHSPIFRYGGDEFVAILKGADLEDRDKRLDYMCREMANMQLAPDEWKRLSIATGIAVCRPEDASALEVLERARVIMLEEKAK
jgi:diguanylate cyclase (GGDEF)-like protein